MSDESVAKLWALVGELSEQLTQNRAVTARLQSQIAVIKDQAVHTNAGFPLRRFNTDLSQEEYQTAIEEFAAKLVLENRTVTHENKQLSLLLREYEATLEGVMGKFRSLAHANATHELALHEHYTKALTAVAHAQGQASLAESTAINAGLGRVGRLLRKALRSEMGEDEDEVEVDGRRSTSDISAEGGYLPPPASTRVSPSQFASRGRSSSTASSSSSMAIPATATAAAAAPSPALAAAAAAGGGGGSRTKTYAQIGDLRLDWALEREAELARLEEENDLLRAMLALDRELGDLLPPPPPPPPLAALLPASGPEDGEREEAGRVGQLLLVAEEEEEEDGDEGGSEGSRPPSATTTTTTTTSTAPAPPPLPSTPRPPSPSSGAPTSTTSSSSSFPPAASSPSSATTTSTPTPLTPPTPPPLTTTTTAAAAGKSKPLFGLSGGSTAEAVLSSGRSGPNGERP